jgi:hypothetical protein
MNEKCGTKSYPIFDDICNIMNYYYIERYYFVVIQRPADTI